MSSKRTSPTPIFDDLNHIGKQAPPKGLSASFSKDFTACCEFLLAYKGSQATFNTYRRDVERLAQWSWLIAEKSILNLQRKLRFENKLFLKRWASVRLEGQVTKEFSEHEKSLRYKFLRSVAFDDGGEGHITSKFARDLISLSDTQSEKTQLARLFGEWRDEGKMTMLKKGQWKFL